MQFDFGKNWQDFSFQALTQEKVIQTKESFQHLIDDMDLRGKSFLDIGFGQGLSLLTACEKGALAVGTDINEKCLDVFQHNKQYFPRTTNNVDVPIVIGSILDPKVVDQLHAASPGLSGYDIVHSWGVLHHTGNMKKAIQHTASLVNADGCLVLAIYNRHWSSPLWKQIKRFYCMTPPPAQNLIISLFYPIIYLAKYAVTGKDPKKKMRGMDFYYDVIDWVGGYPYEYATRSELESMTTGLGFRLVKCIPSEVPTGCNEFIFQKC